MNTLFPNQPNFSLTLLHLPCSTLPDPQSSSSQSTDSPQPYFEPHYFSLLTLSYAKILPLSKINYNLVTPLRRKIIFPLITSALLYCHHGYPAARSLLSNTCLEIQRKAHHYANPFLFKETPTTNHKFTTIHPESLYPAINLQGNPKA